VPGTTMVFPGMPDPEERRLLIEYLENLAPPD
jgi:cytochrome c2